MWYKLLETYLLMKVEALDHKNNKAKASINKWQTRVSRLYSINSNKTHMAVAPPSTPADIFLFLHKKISAAVNIKRKIHKLKLKTKQNYQLYCGKKKSIWSHIELIFNHLPLLTRHLKCHETKYPHKVNYPFFFSIKMSEFNIDKCLKRERKTWNERKKKSYI